MDEMYLIVSVEVRENKYYSSKSENGKCELTLEISPSALREFSFGYNTLENMLRAAKDDYYARIEQKEAETTEE